MVVAPKKPGHIWTTVDHKPLNENDFRELHDCQMWMPF